MVHETALTLTLAANGRVGSLKSFSARKMRTAREPAACLRTRHVTSSRFFDISLWCRCGNRISAQYLIKVVLECTLCVELCRHSSRVCRRLALCDQNRPPPLRDECLRDQTINNVTNRLPVSSPFVRVLSVCVPVGTRPGGPRRRRPPRYVRGVGGEMVILGRSLHA